MNYNIVFTPRKHIGAAAAAAAAAAAQQATQAVQAVRSVSELITNSFIS